MRYRASSEASRWTALLIFAALIAVLVLPAVRPSIEDRRLETVSEGPIVVVGMSGVRWDMVSQEETPNILEFANRSAIANLVVKTIGETTCPEAGWLTLSAGARTLGSPTTGGCAPALNDADLAASGRIPADTWALWQSRNETNAFAPTIGLLGDQLGGLDVISIGSGGAIAAVDSSGEIVGTHLDGGEDPSRVYESEVAGSGADVVFIDLGAARHPAETARQAGVDPAPEDTGETPERLRAQVRLMDRKVGRIIDASGKDARIFLISPGDSDNQTARLQLFAESFTAEISSSTEAVTTPSDTATSSDEEAIDVGENESHPANRGALANTHSTRRPGLVQLTDVTSTLLEAVRRDAVSTVGSTIWAASDMRSVGVTGVYGRISGLVDDEAKGMTIREAVVPFYVLWVSAGFLALAAMVFQRVRPTRYAFRYIVLSVAALPISSMLINILPWWRLPNSSLMLILGSAAFAMVIGLIALGVDRWRRGGGPTVVAGLTAGILALDAIFGSNLHSPSVLGDQPQSGGRFYGLSNAPFVLFAVSMIFLTVVCVRVFLRSEREWLAIPAVIAMGAIATIVDGSPAIGADFGGLPALILAFAVLGLLVLGKRVRPRTILWIVLGSIAAALLVSFVDWLRPTDQRSHLGRFFQSIVDGEAMRVVGRKLGLLANSVPPWAWLLVGVAVVAVIAVLVWLARTDRWRLRISNLDEYGWGAVAVFCLVVFGLVINDSGLVLVLVGILYAVPLWASVAVPSVGQE